MEDLIRGWYKSETAKKEINNKDKIDKEAKLLLNRGRKGSNLETIIIFNMRIGMRKRYYHFQKRELFLQDMLDLMLLHMPQK